MLEAPLDWPISERIRERWLIKSQFFFRSRAEGRIFNSTTPTRGVAIGWTAKRTQAAVMPGVPRALSMTAPHAMALRGTQDPAMHPRLTDRP